MRTRPLLNLILDDEALTRGLGDAEARLLIDWLTDWAEHYGQQCLEEAEALTRVERLRIRGRAIRRFVELWCHRCDFGAATQLAAAEHFQWPLPEDEADPWELMDAILHWEERHLHAA